MSLALSSTCCFVRSNATNSLSSSSLTRKIDIGAVSPNLHTQSRSIIIIIIIIIMKLFLAVTTLFAASAAAAKYVPGQDCRTNKGCDENCLGGKWSVMMVAGGATMVCDPTTLDSTRYVRGFCTGGENDTIANEKGKVVCDNMKGKYCNFYCFLKTPASQEEDLVARYEKVCGEQLNGSGRSYDAFVHVYPTKGAATDGAKCDPSSVFA